MKKLLIVAIVLLVIAIGLLGYLIIDSRTETEKNTESVQENINIQTNNNTSTNSTVDWEIFNNEKYTYSFQYPADCQVSTNHTMSPKETADIVEITGHGCSGLSPVLNVRVVNAENVLPENVELVQKNLLDFTNAIYSDNLYDDNPNVEKVLGDLKKTTVDDQEAYSFTITGGFKGPNASFLIKEKQQFILTEKGSNKFILWHPVDNQKSSLVLSIFQFSD